MYVYTHKHIMPSLPTVFSLTLSCTDILSPHIAKFLCQTLVYLPFLGKLSLPIAHLKTCLEMPQKGVLSLAKCCLLF